MMGGAGARQGILSLAIKDKAALYNAYMPFVKGGGIFVPTAKRYALGDEVFILPVRQIASIVADGELLLITTVTSERYTLTHPLHALEAKLDPRRFVRLGRGTLAALDLIQKVSPMPGGSYEVTLTNGQQLPVSRLQSKVLRETLLKL